MSNLLPGLTRSQVEDYYAQPSVQLELLNQFGSRPVSVVQVQEDGDPIFKRKHGGKYIKIPDAQDITYWATRRHAEFHPTTGKTTDQFIVDIDPGPKTSFSTVKDMTQKVVDTLNDKFPGSSEVAFSGGRGFHVRHPIGKKMRTSGARVTLMNTLRGIAGTTFKKPEGGDIRLDMVAMKPMGSVRAVGSLNAATGLKAMKVNLKDIGGFEKGMAKVARDWGAMCKKMERRRDPDGLEKKKEGRFVTRAELLSFADRLKSAQFAPGLPDQRVMTPIRPNDIGDPFSLAIQKHKTDRQNGRAHYDMRLVDEESGIAHSWAIPKARLPGRKGEKLLAVQQPDHTADYATGFQGRIPEGQYGAGTVTTKTPHPADILKADLSSIIFQVMNGRKNVYNMRRMGNDPKQWFIQKLDARRHGRRPSRLSAAGLGGGEGLDRPEVEEIKPPKIAEPPKVS